MKLRLFTLLALLMLPLLGADSTDPFFQKFFDFVGDQAPEVVAATTPVVETVATEGTAPEKANVQDLVDVAKEVTQFVDAPAPATPVEALATISDLVSAVTDARDSVEALNKSDGVTDTTAGKVDAVLVNLVSDEAQKALEAVVPQVVAPVVDAIQEVVDQGKAEKDKDIKADTQTVQETVVDLNAAVKEVTAADTPKEIQASIETVQTALESVQTAATDLATTVAATPGADKDGKLDDAITVLTDKVEEAIAAADPTVTPTGDPEPTAPTPPTPEVPVLSDADLTAAASSFLHLPVAIGRLEGSLAAQKQAIQDELARLDGLLKDGSSQKADLEAQLAQAETRLRTAVNSTDRYKAFDLGDGTVFLISYQPGGTELVTLRLAALR